MINDKKWYNKFGEIIVYEYPCQTHLKNWMKHQKKNGNKAKLVTTIVMSWSIVNYYFVGKKNKIFFNHIVTGV